MLFEEMFRRMQAKKKRAAGGNRSARGARRGLCSEDEGRSAVDLDPNPSIYMEDREWEAVLKHRSNLTKAREMRRRILSSSPWTEAVDSPRAGLKRSRNNQTFRGRYGRSDDSTSHNSDLGRRRSSSPRESTRGRQAESLPSWRKHHSQSAALGRRNERRAYSGRARHCTGSLDSAWGREYIEAKARSRRRLENASLLGRGACGSSTGPPGRRPSHQARTNGGQPPVLRRRQSLASQSSTPAQNVSGDRNLWNVVSTAECVAVVHCPLPDKCPKCSTSRASAARSDSEQSGSSEAQSPGPSSAAQEAPVVGPSFESEISSSSSPDEQEHVPNRSKFNVIRSRKRSERLEERAVQDKGLSAESSASVLDDRSSPRLGVSVPDLHTSDSARSRSLHRGNCSSSSSSQRRPSCPPALGKMGELRGWSISDQCQPAALEPSVAAVSHGPADQLSPRPGRTHLANETPSRRAQGHTDQRRQAFRRESRSPSTGRLLPVSSRNSGHNNSRAELFRATYPFPVTNVDESVLRQSDVPTVVRGPRAVPLQARALYQDGHLALSVLGDRQGNPTCGKLNLHVSIIHRAPTRSPRPRPASSRARLLNAIYRPRQPAATKRRNLLPKKPDRDVVNRRAQEPSFDTRVGRTTPRSSTQPRSKGRSRPPMESLLQGHSSQW